MGSHVVSQLIKAMEKKFIKTKKSKILIMGLTFKENCPDLRNSGVTKIINELKNLGVVNDVFKTNELDSTLQKYIDKITTSTPESVEVLMKNIDKVRSLNMQDSFLLEEEMGKELF